MKAVVLKFVSFDIVFQEVPSELTLAINISGCPNRCPGCHSQHLTEDCGDNLTESVVDSLVETYKGSVSCVCFMGGDSAPERVEELARYVHARWGLKTAWYSGREVFPEDDKALDYVKLGAYIEEFGGLKSKITNQRMYKNENGEYKDITAVFWK